MGASSSVDSTRTQERRENTLQSRSHLSERSTDLSERDTLRQQKHEQDMQIKWPLPKIEEEKDFVPKRSRIDKSQYSFVRSRYERSELAVRRSVKITTVKFPYVYREERKESNHVESNVFNSAHVQLTMKTKTDLWAAISPSAEMKSLLGRLNVTHFESNEIIQQRLDGVSKEAERVIGLIIKETTDEQDQLLRYAQEVQGRQDELHREWLRQYAVALDRWRSNELSKLHEKLEYSKEKMNGRLQEKLALVNQQVEMAKSEIFREEQERQAKEADNIVSNVEDIARKNKMQHVGTEANTDIHLKIRANAGNKGNNEQKASRGNNMIIEQPTSNEPYYPYLEHEHSDREEFENDY